MSEYSIYPTILSGLLLVACSQSDDQNLAATTLEPPEVVTKASLSTNPWILNNHEIDPQDPQHPVAGIWQSTGSFANHQCFDYTSMAQQTNVGSQLGASFNNLEFAKSFGITTSVKVGLLGFGHNFKLLNTYMSSQTGKYNLDIIYKATVSSKIINQFNGLNAAGKLYAKHGVESFVINCGSHFVNSYQGTLGGLMILTISGTSLTSLEVLGAALKTGEVSFISAINLIKVLQQQPSSGISYAVNFTPYGGTAQDQTTLSGLVTTLAKSPNLQSCLSSLNTTPAGSCNQFIQNDIESGFLPSVAAIFESEVHAGNYSGAVVDDYSQQTISSLYGSQVGFNKVQALPDPFAGFPIESQFLLAADLTLATQMESNQAQIINSLYSSSTDSDIKNAASGMIANATIYSNLANLGWQQLQQCLSNYQCNNVLSNPALLLQYLPNALNNFYYLAYIAQQSLKFTTTNAVVQIPAFLYSDGRDTLVIASQMATAQNISFKSPLYRIINESAIGVLNNNLHMNSYMRAEVNFGASNPFNGFIMPIYNYNFDNNQQTSLNCNLTKLNSSCTASIMTSKQGSSTDSNSFINQGLFISTQNPFYTLPNPN